MDRSTEGIISLCFLNGLLNTKVRMPYPQLRGHPAGREPGPGVRDPHRRNRPATPRWGGPSLHGGQQARTINNGLTVVGIDVYARQVFLGILIIIAVAVTFDRKKVTIIK
jgi:hypothetical protein